MKNLLILTFIMLFFSTLNAKAQKNTNDGVWVGQGYQFNNNSTWSVKLKIQDNIYTIDYPSINCKAKLLVEKIEDNKIYLSEKLTSGNCVSGGRVVLEIIGSNEILYKWSFINGEPGSYARLIRF